MHNNKELAEMLVKQGIAFSKSHALEMAEEMNSTGKKVTDHFNEKKEEVTMGYKSKPLDMSNPYVQENVRRMRENAMNNKPLDVQSSYETPASGAIAVEEPTTEIAREEASKPEEELSQDAPEADVDLTSLFNFGK